MPFRNFKQLVSHEQRLKSDVFCHNSRGTKKGLLESCKRFTNLFLALIAWNPITKTHQINHKFLWSVTDFPMDNDDGGFLRTNIFHTPVDDFQMELESSDKPQTPINKGHLRGRWSLPLVVLNANTVTYRDMRTGRGKRRSGVCFQSWQSKEEISKAVIVYGNVKLQRMDCSLLQLGCLLALNVSGQACKE